jgi:hypothetical protein
MQMDIAAIHQEATRAAEKAAADMQQEPTIQELLQKATDKMDQMIAKLDAAIQQQEKTQQEEFQVVEVTVRMWIKKGADMEDTINEADWRFEHEDIVACDITDFKGV